MVALLPDCVSDATTLCIPYNSTAIQYGPAGAHVWSLGTVLIMNPAGVYVPVAETHVKGATAHLSFTGTSVAVFGSQEHHDKDTGGVSYAVDGGAPTTNSTLELQTSPTEYQFPLFSASGLSGGTHTLEITNIGSTFTLTYFKVGKVELTGTITVNVTSSAATSGSQALSSSAPGNQTTTDVSTSLSAIFTTKAETTVVTISSSTSTPTAPSAPSSTSSSQSANDATSTASITTSATGAASTGSAARARTGLSLRTVGVVAFGTWLVLGGLSL